MFGLNMNLDLDLDLSELSLSQWLSLNQINLFSSQTKLSSFFCSFNRDSVSSLLLFENVWCYISVRVSLLLNFIPCCLIGLKKKADIPPPLSGLFSSSATARGLVLWWVNWRQLCALPLHLQQRRRHGKEPAIFPCFQCNSDSPALTEVYGLISDSNFLLD